MTLKAPLILVMLTLVLTIATACFSRGNPATPLDDSATEEANLPATVESMPTTLPATATTAMTSAMTSIESIEMGGIDATVIENVESIERYRMRVTYTSQGTGRDSETVIEAAYSKEPPAESITVTFAENDQQETIAMVLVDGVRYIKAGEVFVQTPDAAMSLQELTLIQPQDVDLSSEFTRIGEEEINGRSTLHYQGGPGAVPTGGTAGDTFDVTGIASATIDLWIDQAEKFIVAMAVQVDGLDEAPDALFQMRFDYFDFNSPEIVIAVPEDALAMQGDMPETATDDSPAVDVATPRNDLGKLLGFDLPVATGSQITAVTNQLVQVNSIYTLDEAVNLFQLLLPANGYTLLNAITPQADERVLMFQKGAQVATIQIKVTAQGSDWDVVVAP